MEKDTHASEKSQYALFLTLAKVIDEELVDSEDAKDPKLVWLALADVFDDATDEA